MAKETVKYSREGLIKGKVACLRGGGKGGGSGAQVMPVCECVWEAQGLHGTGSARCVDMRGRGVQREKVRAPSDAFYFHCR